MKLPDFVEIALFEALKKYAKFEGRANRPQFWYFVLTEFLAFFIIVLLCLIPFVNIIAFLALLVYCFGLIVPRIAVTVRRLHDTNRSGWWLLLCFVPFVGSIVILVFMCLEGTKGANKYGDEPVVENYKF
ncbi:MAG: DUF805 domain-containing protein [Succinivibrio sp.]|nr:DUF805 domain-containing protein [Succinivibrio sp.]